MPMEFIVSSLRVISITNMAKIDIVQRRLDKLMDIEDDIFIASFHQRVQKVQQKS